MKRTCKGGVNGTEEKKLFEVRESAIDERAKGFTEENEYLKNDYADLVGLYVCPEVFYTFTL